MLATLGVRRLARPRRWPGAVPMLSSFSTSSTWSAATPTSSSVSTSSSSSSSPAKPPPRPPNAPRVNVDIRHIRQHPELHAANCVRRNYAALQDYPAQIVHLFAGWQARQRDGRVLREEANAVRRRLANPPVAREVDEETADAPQGESSASSSSSSSSHTALLAHARDLKQQLATIETDEARLTADMQRRAAALPNLTSADTPDTQRLLCYIGCDGDADGPGGGDDNAAAAAVTARLRRATAGRSHVHIGTQLGLLDFASAAQTSGWGWYYLLGDGARLEQALVQFALTTAHRHGWLAVSPPSLVRTTMAAACGFQPRDQGGEQQTYVVEEDGDDEGNAKRTSLSLTATAEIPLAALYADTTLPDSGLPLRRAAVSRCYRAEAGARGAATKGLYRVHEFTKVELFAWTAPDLAAATETYDELVDLQTEILSELGLPCRVLEMPASDLGASAYRKIDIEAFFPSRCGPDTTDAATADPDAGWGEVTSASICTDYQTRRLATRARHDGALAYPWTLNGTALAVPRIIAALLENGWDEEAGTVAIPECLQPWMDGQQVLGGRQ